MHLLSGPFPSEENKWKATHCLPTADRLLPSLAVFDEKPQVQPLFDILVLTQCPMPRFLSPMPDMHQSTVLEPAHGKWDPLGPQAAAHLM